jgi:hypothetical protein
MPREAVLDAEVLKRAAEKGVESAQTLSTNFRPTDPQQFLLRVRERHGMGRRARQRQRVTHRRAEDSATNPILSFQLRAVGRAAPAPRENGEAEADAENEAPAAEVNWDAIAEAVRRHYRSKTYQPVFLSRLQSTSVSFWRLFSSSARSRRPYQFERSPSGRRKRHPLSYSDQKKRAAKLPRIPKLDRPLSASRCSYSTWNASSGKTSSSCS